MSTPSRDQAITGAGEVLATILRTREAMTPRELAEASWTPTCGRTVDDLEDQVRAERGLEPRARSA